MRRTACALSVLFGCVGETPPNPVPAPGLDRLTVFFPVDGVVFGRGAPGAVPEDFGHIAVRALPIETEFVFGDVAKDGSFTFQIPAASDDILEVAFAAFEDPHSPRGAPTFIEVPRPLLVPDERIPIFHGDVTVSPPDVNGRVKLTSQAPHLASHLIRVENRGQRAIGRTDPMFHVAAIADERGRMELFFSAAGDDELVIRAHAVDGNTTSREHAIYVPDSPLIGVDVLGVFPRGGLAEDSDGTVGVRIAPFGLDRRGICPPSRSPGLALCFSGGHEDSTGINPTFDGGLDYEMLDVVITMDGQPTHARPAADPEMNTRFTQGDVLAGPASIVIIVDHSQTSDDADVDPARLRFRAAEDLVKSARSSDEVAVIATGKHMGKAPTFSVRAELGSKASALMAIQALRSEQAWGENDLGGALIQAARMLDARLPAPRGHIVVLSVAPPSDQRAPIESVLDGILANERRNAYPVHVLARPFDTTTEAGDAADDDLQTYAQFSSGLRPQDDVFGEGLITAASAISGAFALTYDVHVPRGVGDKSTKVVVELALRLKDTTPGSAAITTVRASYEGILDLRNNAAP